MLGDLEEGPRKQSSSTMVPFQSAANSVFGYLTFYLGRRRQWAKALIRKDAADLFFVLFCF